MAWTHRNLIVPAAFADAARELCAAVHPAGAGMFTVPLSPTGELPATHWASTGLLEAVWAPALEDPAMFFGAAQLGAAQLGAFSVPFSVFLLSPRKHLHLRKRW